jgi:serine/threonine protein kinase
MLIALVKDAVKSDAADIALLRQRIIVQLLLEGSSSSEAVAALVRQFVKQGVLTRDVHSELEILSQAKGLVRASSQLEDAVVRVTAPATNQTSRFAHEFEVLERLGNGASGAVWRVRSRVDAREYAVKAVPYRFPAEEDPYEHASVHEARALAGVNHPNIIRYYASWVEVDAVDNVTTETDGAIASARCMTSVDTHMSAISIASGGDSGVVFEDTSTDFEPAAKEQPQTDDCFAITTRRAARPMRQATLYVQTEVARGGTLRQWLDKRNESLAQPNVDQDERARWVKWSWSIFRECVGVAAHLHNLNLVHRDIKPENIMLAADGTVRLGDFGLAMMGENVMFPQRAGTPTYASPEQLNAGRCTVQADIHALGVILCEMLFPVQTRMERAVLLEGLRERRLPSETESLAAVSDGCQGAVGLALAMTSTDPDERPRAAEIAACVQKVELETVEFRASQQGGSCGRAQSMRRASNAITDGPAVSTDAGAFDIGADLVLPTLS